MMPMKSAEAADISAEVIEKCKKESLAHIHGGIHCKTP